MFTLLTSFAPSRIPQMLYGTIIYFSSYVHARRFQGCSNAAVAVVIFANGIWLLFPALAMHACWAVVRDGDMAVFRTPG